MTNGKTSFSGLQLWTGIASAHSQGVSRVQIRDIANRVFPVARLVAGRARGSHVWNPARPDFAFGKIQLVRR